jgi:hypothetical protein
MTSTPALDEAVALVARLSPIEKVRLMERLIATLEQDLAQDISERDKRPFPSLYGLCADLGPAPSAEDIQEVRDEMWKNFPREDI